MFFMPTFIIIILFIIYFILLFIYNLLFYSGKIHPIWIVVNFSASELFRRNPSLVWPLPIGQFSLQRLPIFGCSVTCLCASVDHQDIRNSNVGETRHEKMGPYTGIPTIFVEHPNSHSIHKLVLTYYKEK